MAKLVRARRNPFASEAFAHDFDQVIAGLRAKGTYAQVFALAVQHTYTYIHTYIHACIHTYIHTHVVHIPYKLMKCMLCKLSPDVFFEGVKCIVSAPSGDSGSSDSQDVAADFILHGSVLQVVVIWLDLLNTQRSPSSNREAMVSQETRAVLEDKISKIQDSRVVVMVRAASMSVFEECQVLTQCSQFLPFAALAAARSCTWRHCLVLVHSELQADFEVFCC